MEKTPRPNRIREALGQLHEQQPPYFREYLRRFQEDPTSRVFAPLAEAYRRLGRFEEAIAICLEGLEHHPEFHGGRVVLAKAYIAKTKWAEAKSELERVVHSVPENLLGQRLLGDVLLNMGNKPGALHCYKMALLLAPADVVLSEKVRELEEGLTEADYPAESVVDAKPEKLPENPEDLERDIPPLWSMEIPDTIAGGAFQRTSDLAPEPMIMTGPEARSSLLALNGDQENPIDDEAFKIEHVSSIFEEGPSSKKEITTETLGDLYYSQGQFDKALRIFEKLKQTPKIEQKMDACRARLGVDMSSLLRTKKIALLRAVLERLKEMRPDRAGA